VFRVTTIPGLAVLVINLALYCRCWTRCCSRLPSLSTSPPSCFPRSWPSTLTAAPRPCPIEVS